MATLLRQRRACAICHRRAQCEAFQLLAPRRHDRAGFFEWYEAWLCPPCKRSVISTFTPIGVREVGVVV